MLKRIGELTTPVGGMLPSRIATNNLLRTAMQNTFNAEHFASDNSQNIEGLNIFF